MRKEICETNVERGEMSKTKKRDKEKSYYSDLDACNFAIFVLLSKLES